jgi:hypothetical protein
VSRSITPAQAAEQGEIIYQTGWPRRLGLVVWLFELAWWGAWLAIWLVHLAGTAGASTLQLGLFGIVWVFLFVRWSLSSDIVVITRTAVRRRSYLSTLRGHGFRTVDLAPNSWFVRSKHTATRVLWVGSRPHGKPQDLLTMKLGFEDDARPLYAALESVGVEIQDEQGEWVRRRPIMARLEMGLVTAFLASFPILTLIPSVQLAAVVMLAGLAIAVVHWMAR